MGASIWNPASPIGSAAAAIAFAATANISATNVQAAIVEVDSEYRASIDALIASLPSLAYPYFDVAADGTTDDTAACQAAIDNTPYGGVCFLPKGRIKLTDELVLHAGITVQGLGGAADFIYGSPPAVASDPTMLCQTTPNKACLRIGGGMHNITVRNMAFSPVVNPSYPSSGAGTTDGKSGILLTSSTKVVAPIPADNGHVWGLRFEDLTFYNLNYGFNVTDPHAGDTGAGDYPYDWSVAPVILSNVRFIFPKIGIRFNTSNADAWVISNSQFSIPSGGDGLALYRWGLLKLINCISGGAVSNDRFVHVYNNGTVNGVEDIVLEQCQGESLTQFICVDTGVAAAYNFSIVCRDNVGEITSDVYLGSPCHFVSTRNRWTCNIYIDHAGVKIDSMWDFFSGSFRFQFLKGSISACVNTLLPSSDATFYSNVQVIGGRTTRYASASPTTEVYKIQDRVVNSVPTVGQPKAWVCTVAGGAVSGTRANSTAYAANLLKTWSTGTTVWEITTAGTTAGAAPSIVGKVVDDTVVDGTVTWTMRSLTTATFISEGNL